MSASGEPVASAAAPPAPVLTHAFSAHVEVGAPVELGGEQGCQRRFIPILGGRVMGPRLQGEVLPGGGDWQTILPAGLAQVEARYLLRAADGTVIEIANPGVRAASVAVTQDLARGVPVDPSAYYFRTSPRFRVSAGPHAWLERTIFVGRGTRYPDRVVIDIFSVE